VSIESLLTGERREPGGLADVAVVAVDDVELHVEAAEPDKTNDIVEADRGAPGFPSCNGGLHCACPVGELGLGQTRTPSSLADKITAVRTHAAIITDLLYRMAAAGSAVRAASARDIAAMVVKKRNQRPWV
jgi:hypothetical protein